MTNTSSITNVYQITSCTQDGSFIYVLGSVNGQMVSIQLPFKVYPNTASMIAAIETAMMSAYNQLPQPVQGIVGTYTV